MYRTVKQKWTYMPYLTLWDKISQNLAHLEAISYKIFKSHRIFRPSYNTFLWRNRHTSHFVVVITNFMHNNKGFWLFRESFKVIFVKISQNFIKSHLNICLISQIAVHSLWHVWMNCIKKVCTVNPLYNVSVGPQRFMTLKWICHCNDFLLFRPQDEQLQNKCAATSTWFAMSEFLISNLDKSTGTGCRTIFPGQVFR